MDSVTASHPWLTADRGWVRAGTLHIGEAVVTADGADATATVVALQVVAGAAAMWDLTVSQVHTFAVGSGQFVVHNCDPEGAANDLASRRAAQGLPPAGSPDDDTTLARLDIDGRSYYGQAGNSQEITLKVNAISRYHAETNAFQSALNAGEWGGDGVLYVDRPMCPACGANGMVRSLGRQLSLRSLVVYSPLGREVLF